MMGYLGFLVVCCRRIFLRCSGQTFLPLSSHHFSLVEWFSWQIWQWIGILDRNVWLTPLSQDVQWQWIRISWVCALNDQPLAIGFLCLWLSLESALPDRMTGFYNTHFDVILKSRRSLQTITLSLFVFWLVPWGEMAFLGIVPVAGCIRPQESPGKCQLNLSKTLVHEIQGAVCKD